MVIREDPLIADNYFGRSTLVSLRAHHTAPPSVALCGVGWIAGHSSDPAHYNHDMEAYTYVHTHDFALLK